MVNFLLVSGHMYIEICWHGLRSWFDLNEHIEVDDRLVGEVHLKVECPVSIPGLFTAHEIQACIYNHQDTLKSASSSGVFSWSYSDMI